MHAYQEAFITFILEQKVLQFGDFTLKSGRKSPYFFNVGAIHHGAALAKLGEFYAETIDSLDLSFDSLFGPAYKGIPLACTTAIALQQKFNKDVPYTFNRKEAKDHGEGGHVVGAPLQGNILLVDDVMTAGTAVKESMKILEDYPATLSGVLIALDRQEKGQGHLPAVTEIANTYQTKVHSIITLDNIIEYLDAVSGMQAKAKLLKAIKAC